MEFIKKCITCKREQLSTRDDLELCWQCGGILVIKTVRGTRCQSDSNPNSGGKKSPTDEGIEEMSAGVQCSEELRSCNNDDCDWVGPISQTVHPKHVPEMILCPVCNETTECVNEQTQSGS